MIVSHKYKFIFSKPRKVAGTSIEVALSKYCGPDDSITPNVSSADIDADAYTDYARNWEGFFNHMRPSRIRQCVGRSVWNNYYKFTIVRNPWDMVVSRFFWNKKNATPHKTVTEVLGELSHDPFNIDLYGKLYHAIVRAVFQKELAPDDDFRTFVLRKLPNNITNTKYYFDWRGRPYNDFVIRYEHLEEDYAAVCKRIGIPTESLPSLKTKTRSSRDYRQMYDAELREVIARKFKKEIEYFVYTFEGEPINAHEAPKTPQSL